MRRLTVRLLRLLNLRQLRTKVIAGVAALALVLAGIALTLQSQSPAYAAALTPNWYGSAPYVMPLDNTPPDLPTVMSATGEKAFELAFILDGGSCTPAWDGTAPVSSDTAVAAIINSVRTAGGDVSVSAGGYNGTKLGQTCGSPSATAAAYQQVINKYSLHAIDFDLEEPEIENATAINNELAAAQILQRNNSGLYVSVTIPGTTSGANYFGQQLLNNAKSLGFTPNNYAIMPFDGGFNGSSSQITALEAFHTQLMNTFSWDSTTAYQHEGVSQMNGRSDTGEYFYQSDFQSVLSYATGHGLTRYTFWSVNRDRQCNPPDNNGTTSGTCSSVTQNAWDFTKYDTQFAGATPPTNPPTPTPGATSTPGGGGGSGCAPAWNSSTAYTGGAVVSYNGHNWTAKWWTQNDVPGGPAGVWTDDGPCGSGGGGNPTPTPTTPPNPTPTPTTPPPTPTPSGGGGGSVVNGGFETGSLSPWTCTSNLGSIVTSPVHSGSYALSGAPNNSDDAQCSQTISVQANHTYTLSGWVNGAYVYLGVSGTGTSDVNNWTPGTNGAYSQLSVSFTTGASTTSVTVYVHGWYAQGTYYADDIAVH